MTTQALAGSDESFWPAHVCDDVVERFAGKLLDLSCWYQRQAFEQVDEIRFGSFARRAERSAADFFRLGDLLVLVFTGRRLLGHGRNSDRKRNRIAFNVFGGDEG